jgi:hypothetical protein
MLIKSGLGSDDLRTMNPLDIEGARRLQQLSSQYEKNASSSNLMQIAKIKRASSEPTAAAVSSSVEKLNIFNPHSKDQANDSTQNQQQTNKPGKVGLEYLVQM